jgi:hypothetical protein
MGIVGGVLKGQMDAVKVFSDFVYLFSEDDSSESFIETVPDGVAAAVDGMLAVPVATDASPLRLHIELHDRRPPSLAITDGEDVAVLAWCPRGVTSHGSWLVDHGGCGGIQVLPLRASWMAARGWWPWLRAVVR